MQRHAKEMAQDKMEVLNAGIKNISNDSPKTGVKFDAGKPPLALLSGAALTEVAKVLEFGSRKYNAWNWKERFCLESDWRVLPFVTCSHGLVGKTKTRRLALSPLGSLFVLFNVLT